MEGREQRSFFIIQCSCCGTQTFERRESKVKRALERGCRSCRHLEAEAKAEEHAMAVLKRALLRLAEQAERLERKAAEKAARGDRRVKHGLCRGETKLTYDVWKGMHSRCTNPKNPAFKYYGGRGIKVCQRWDDPAVFIADMGLVPDGHSLERVNVNGDYEPDNCTWIPKEKQAANRQWSYCNRGIEDPKGFAKLKIQKLSSGEWSVDDIPFSNKQCGWWRDFGLYHNPYIYGPMPWKRTSIQHRRAEAIERGWHKPKAA